MKRHLHLIIISAALSLTPFFSSAADGNESLNSSSRKLEFNEIMAIVREQLPQEPVAITGRLLTSQRIGMPEPVCHVEANLDMGAKEQKAVYVIRDLFGEPTERMTIKRNVDLTSEVKYEKGETLRQEQAPDFNESIHGTDITWNDLTFSFLWRQDGKLTGSENIRGRSCFIVEFKNSGFTRLWIDDTIFMIIQAEEYDPKGQRIRRISIKNIKKIGDVWMIKDMEVRRYPSMARTLLRIDDMSSKTTAE